MSEDIELQNIGQKSIYWLFAVIVITAVIFAVLLMFTKYSNTLRHVPPELIARTQTTRFITSPQCFIAVDSAGKTSQGLIDRTKFTETRINDCYPTADRNVNNYKLALKDMDSGAETTIQTANYRNQIAFTYFYPVRIKDGQTIKRGRLTIYVQLPQSEFLAALARRQRGS